MTSKKCIRLCVTGLCLAALMSCSDTPIRLESADPAAVTRISQAPYRYQHVTYWTLANGCTYSRGFSGRGGWRWFLVGNPMSPDQGVVHEGCTFVFDASD